MLFRLKLENASGVEQEVGVARFSLEQARRDSRTGAARRGCLRPSIRSSPRSRASWLAAAPPQLLDRDEDLVNSALPVVAADGGEAGSLVCSLCGLAALKQLEAEVLKGEQVAVHAAWASHALHTPSASSRAARTSASSCATCSSISRAIMLERSRTSSDWCSDAIADMTKWPSSWKRDVISPFFPTTMRSSDSAVGSDVARCRPAS